MEYDEVKIKEQRYNDLINHESETSSMLENIVRYFVSELISKRGKKYDYFEDIADIEKYVNERLAGAKIIFNNKPSHVWKNSSNSLMYWDYTGSRTIYLSDIIIQKCD